MLEYCKLLLLMMMKKILAFVFSLMELLLSMKVPVCAELLTND